MQTMWSCDGLYWPRCQWGKSDLLRVPGSYCLPSNHIPSLCLLAAFGLPFMWYSSIRSSSCWPCLIWRQFSPILALCHFPLIAWTSPTCTPRQTVRKTIPAMDTAANGLYAPAARPIGLRVLIIVAFASGAYVAWIIIVRGSTIVLASAIKSISCNFFYMWEYSRSTPSGWLLGHGCLRAPSVVRMLLNRSCACKYQLK